MSTATRTAKAAANPTVAELWRDLGRTLPGIPSDTTELRDIAFAQGWLWKGRVLTLELRAVDEGVVSGSYTQQVGSSNARLDSFVWFRVHCPIALCRASAPDGPVVRLVALGPTVTGGGGPLGASFQPKFKQTCERTIPWIGNRIIYVEGDREFVLHTSMSIDRFALRNPNGHFLIVVASVR
jgi:hypothetical protein